MLNDELAPYAASLPQAFSPVVLSLRPMLLRSLHPPHVHHPLQIQLADETLLIPSRIYTYVPPKSEINELTQLQRKVVAMLFTRHHDGRVRQRFARDLNPAVPCELPFLIQLLGEYVVEIIDDVNNALPRTPTSVIQDFATLNRGFVQTTCRRITSYWHTHGQPYYSKFTEFPAYMAFDRLALWDHALTPKITAGLQRD